MVLTHNKSTRPPELLNMWARQIKRMGADVIWLGSYPFQEKVLNIPDEKFTFLARNTLTQSDQILYRTVCAVATACNYFINHQQYKWFIRANDDTWVNLDKFPRFLAHLENYDPINEPIVKHHCIHYPNCSGYPQGGAGMLWSRRAVELFLPRMNSWSSSITHTEDMFVPILFKDANITAFEGSSEYFMGHGFNPYYSEIKYNFGTQFPLPRCPVTKQDWDRIQVPSYSGAPTCQQKVYQLNNVVFYHGLNMFQMKQRIQQFRALISAPDEIKVFNNGMLSYLCRDDGDEHLLFNFSYSKHWGPVSSGPQNIIDLYFANYENSCPPHLRRK